MSSNEEHSHEHSHEGGCGCDHDHHDHEHEEFDYEDHRIKLEFIAYVRQHYSREDLESDPDDVRQEKLDKLLTQFTAIKDEQDKQTEILNQQVAIIQQRFPIECNDEYKSFFNVQYWIDNLLPETKQGFDAANIINPETSEPSALPPLTEVAQHVYKVQLYNTEFLHKVSQFIAYAEKWLETNNFNLIPPNSMNRYGISLEYLGLGPTFVELTQYFFQSIAPCHYPYILALAPPDQDEIDTTTTASTSSSCCSNTKSTCCDSSNTTNCGCGNGNECKCPKGECKCNNCPCDNQSKSCGCENGDKCTCVDCKCTNCKCEKKDAKSCCSSSTTTPETTKSCCSTNNQTQTNCGCGNGKECKCVDCKCDNCQCSSTSECKKTITECKCNNGEDCTCGDNCQCTNCKCTKKDTKKSVIFDNLHVFTVQYRLHNEKEELEKVAIETPLSKQNVSSLSLHTDASHLTLNLCLGEEFTAGDLYLQGHRCMQHQQDNNDKLKLTDVQRTDLAEEISLPQLPGYAYIHSGTLRHGAAPITSGFRQNLILWAVSNKLLQQFGGQYFGPCLPCAFESIDDGHHHHHDHEHDEHGNCCAHDSNDQHEHEHEHGDECGNGCSATATDSTQNE